MRRLMAVHGPDTRTLTKSYRRLCKEAKRIVEMHHDEIIAMARGLLDVARWVQSELPES